MSCSQICGALLAALAAGLAACSDLPGEPPRHLVLITLDTLRSDRLGSYGYWADTSPNLDALAERGVRFGDAVAQSIATPPSHASILTGLTPPSHGLRRLVRHKLNRENDTLAEILKNAGFSTAAFVSALPLRQDTGLDQGFDFYEDTFTVRNLVEERPAFETNDAVRSWLTAPPDQRLFLWVHYFDPHCPYYPPEEYRARFGVQDQRRKWLVIGFNANPETRPPKRRKRIVPPHQMAKMSKLYDSAVSYTDAAVGELLQQLEAAGILQDAIVAVVADHGEMLGEYGYYFGHWDVYEETARVPMLLVHPRGHFAGKVVESLVGTIDLVPRAWWGPSTSCLRCSPGWESTTTASSTAATSHRSSRDIGASRGRFTRSSSSIFPCAQFAPTTGCWSNGLPRAPACPRESWSSTSETAGKSVACGSPTIPKSSGVCCAPWSL